MNNQIKKMLVSLLLPCLLTSHLIAAPPQRANSWCWAAAIERVTGRLQEQVVIDLYGRLTDSPANMPQIQALLTRYGYQTTLAMRPPTPQEFAGTL